MNSSSPHRKTFPPQQGSGEDETTPPHDYKIRRQCHRHEPSSLSSSLAISVAVLAQDPPPKAQDRRIVVSRSKENPRVMTQDLRAWKMFIGFQHNEILVVSTSEAVITDGTDFLAHVGNGTTLVGFPQTDLMNAIDTAGDLSQIRVEIR